jgi:DNA mismatch repair ATPase MutS
MKALLMYRDRDFDPQQLLVRREQELRHSRGKPNQSLNLSQALPWNEAALRQDLGLDILLNAMAQGDAFLREVAAVALLSSLRDLETIRFRQQAVADCLKNALIVREIYKVALEAIEGERKSFWSFYSKYPSGVLSRGVQALQMFAGMLKKLRSIADQHASDFKSEGFVRLFATLNHELSDEYFDEIERHLNRLKFRHGVLISAHLGNGNKGESYILRKPHEDTRSWLSRWLAAGPPAYTFNLHPRDEAGARTLAELTDRGVNLVANAVAQSTDHILSFFQMLRTEMAFYVGCLNLHDELRRLAEPMCFPAIAPAGQRVFSCIGLYDASLALSMGRKVVGNDVNAGDSDLVVVTGANTGGKSTFLRSVGVAHLMMQAGMFVAAGQFSAEMADGLYTHYKREEDTTMESGKWDEELRRMNELVSKIESNSFVLFNESFASTNEREGSEIASQIVNALLDRHVKVFFVTHLYHFANAFVARRPERSTFLRAERRPDGTRPFKLRPGKPLQTSYGEDLYRAIFSDEGEQRQVSSSMAGKATV